MKKVKQEKSADGVKVNKFISFVKNNIYFILMALCVIALATIISIAAAVNSKDDTNVADVGANVEDENKEPVEDDPTTPTIEDSFILEMPVANYTIGQEFSNTALVWNETQGHWATHEGVDFMAAAGNNVKCAYAGTVKTVETDSFYGTTVVISHKDGYETTYKLLDKVTVKVGDSVAKGQVIGVISADALAEIAQGPHLHFELSKDGVKINPMDYMLEGDK